MNMVHLHPYFLTKKDAVASSTVFLQSFCYLYFSKKRRNVNKSTPLTPPPIMYTHSRSSSPLQGDIDIDNIITRLLEGKRVLQMGCECTGGSSLRYCSHCFDIPSRINKNKIVFLVITIYDRTCCNVSRILVVCISPS